MSYTLDLPDGIVGGPVEHTNPEIETMAIWRGWLGDAPVCVIASTRPRAGRHLRAFTAQLAARFIEPREREVDVAGARGARRVDGLHEMELGLAADWIEWMTVVVAADGDRSLITLTVRTRPGDELASVHDEIVASLRIGRAFRPPTNRGTTSP